MAFIFQIKRVGSDPTSGALASGELGYNTSTKQLFVGNGAASASAVAMDGHTHTKSQITDFPTIPTTAAQVGAEPAFTKGTAFNKNFGTGSTDVAQGNHTHSGYITATEADQDYAAKAHESATNNPHGVTASQVGAEPAITAGTTAQYYRGDKSWQTFPTIPTTAAQVGALSTSGGTVTGSTTINGAVMTATTKTILGTSTSVLNIASRKVWFDIGAVFNGTAAAAGLVTRGISGTTSDASAKDNLYINYDSTNTYSATRHLILQAGEAGTHYGSNLYQYAAARGDAVKGYCDATYATKTHEHSLSDVSTHISENSSGVSIYGDTSSPSTQLFIGDDSTFEFGGNTVITSANVSGYVSSGAAITSIKNWTNYVTCTGTTGAALPVTASSFIDGYLGIVWNATPSAAQGRKVSWIKLNQATGSTYHISVSEVRPGSTSTATYIDRFTVSGSASGSLFVDDIYVHTINDTASENHPVAQATIYVWDVLKMTL